MIDQLEQQLALVRTVPQVQSTSCCTFDVCGYNLTDLLPDIVTGRRQQVHEYGYRAAVNHHSSVLGSAGGDVSQRPRCLKLRRQVEC